MSSVADLFGAHPVLKNYVEAVKAFELKREDLASLDEDGVSEMFGVKNGFVLKKIVEAIQKIALSTTPAKQLDTGGFISDVNQQTSQPAKGESEELPAGKR